MAENTGEHGSGRGNVDELRVALTRQCATESRNTLYTSTSFFIWLRSLRFFRGSIWVSAVVCSTVAASSAIKDFGLPPLIVAGLTLAGVLLPGVVKALKIDEAIEQYSARAAMFKNAEAALQRAAQVWSNKDIEDFEREARTALGLLDEARSVSLTPPEWAFKMAQAKVKSGDYDPDGEKEDGCIRRLMNCLFRKR